jgi:hypothetical protein
MKIQDAILALVALAAPCMAVGQTSSTEYSLKEGTPATGTSVKREILRGSQVPLDKEWHDLSKPEQQVIRAEYECLSPDTEPPYPKGGLRAIYKPIADAYQRVSGDVGDGEILMVAHIDKDGVPTKLEVYKSPNHKKFTSFVAGTVMNARYKPALCGSNPCQMPFVVAIRLHRQ